MKDIICRYAFLQETLIWSFLRSNLYLFWTLAKIILCNSDETGFLSDCPSLMLGIAIYCIQHSQAMLLERGVCELTHSFFHFSLFSQIVIINISPFWMGHGFEYRQIWISFAQGCCMSSLNENWFSIIWRNNVT